MKKEFDDILDICLDRILLKGDTIEQCLESYPERAAELEPLLRTALSTVKASSSIKPRPEFERIGKHRLLAALEQNRKKRTEPRTRLWSWHRRWATALVAVLVILLAGVGTVSASASSLPGDTLYPVKTAAENVQGFFTFGSEAKANFYMSLAQRRLNELNKLVEENRNIPPSLLETMGSETDDAIKLLSGNQQLGNESVDRLMGLTSNQNAVLTELIEKVPPTAKEKIQEALNKSEDAQGKALLLKDKVGHTGKPQMSPSHP
jgi:hypothetical protein